MRLIKDETLEAMAKAVQAADGSADQMTPEEMAARVTELGGLMERLTKRTITDADFQKIQDVFGMTNNSFAYCKNLEHIKLKGDNGNYCRGIFNECNNLKTVDMSEWRAAYLQPFFFRYTKIEVLDFPETIRSVHTACTNNKSLRIVRFHGKAMSNPSYQLQTAFSDCTALELVDFSDYTGDIIPIINSDCFKHVPNTCKILVPVSKIRAWKAASNWSSLASQIVCSLDEGYTVSGTIPIGTYINGLAITASQTKITGVHCIGAPTGSELVLSNGTTITAEQGDVLLDADIAIGASEEAKTYYYVTKFDGVDFYYNEWTEDVPASGEVQLTAVCDKCGAIHHSMVQDYQLFTTCPTCQECGDGLGFVCRDGLTYCSSCESFTEGESCSNCS